MTPKDFVKKRYLTKMAREDLEYINVIQEGSFPEIEKQENMIRWLQFKSNGKFHLLVEPTIRDLMSKRQYLTVCGLNITQNVWRNQNEKKETRHQVQ